MTRFQVRECSASACRFRFPWTEGDRPELRCPRCGAAVTIVSEQTGQDEALVSCAQRPAQMLSISALLDNVRSTFNVGSIFRCADGAAVRHLYLCGITPTPAHPKLVKTALGAEQSVGWSQHNNALDLAQRLKADGNALWALENQPDAESLLAVEPIFATSGVILVVGNEVTGVDPALLALCDRTVAIPMYGAKRSLNVAIAFGIAVYGLHTLKRLQVV